MVKVMFVCLGNICRSPMAECVMSKMIKDKRLDDRIKVASSATSFEETGNPIYPPAQRKLKEEDVEVLAHKARRITPRDAQEYDYIVAMEERNVRAIKQIVADRGNIYRLMDFSSTPKDIQDPWWSGDFDAAYNDIAEGCKCLLKHIETNDLHISNDKNENQ